METEIAARQRTVLCVDDDEQLRPLLGQIMQNAGFTVTEAATCKAAKQAMQLASPTFVLLDIDLPDGNGFELAKSWRGDGQTALPILFISGREHASCKVKATALNASFLPKPFDPATLLAAVNSLLKA